MQPFVHTPGDSEAQLEAKANAYFKRNRAAQVFHLIMQDVRRNQYPGLTCADFHRRFPAEERVQALEARPVLRAHVISSVLDVAYMVVYKLTPHEQARLLEKALTKGKLTHRQFDDLFSVIDQAVYFDKPARLQFILNGFDWSSTDSARGRSIVWWCQAFLEEEGGLAPILTPHAFRDVFTRAMQVMYCPPEDASANVANPELFVSSATTATTAPSVPPPRNPGLTSSQMRTAIALRLSKLLNREVEVPVEVVWEVLLQLHWIVFERSEPKWLDEMQEALTIRALLSMVDPKQHPYERTDASLQQLRMSFLAVRTTIHVFERADGAGSATSASSDVPTTEAIADEATRSVRVETLGTSQPIGAWSRGATASSPVARPAPSHQHSRFENQDEDD